MKHRPTAYIRDICLIILLQLIRELYFINLTSSSLKRSGVVALDPTTTVSRGGRRHTNYITKIGHHRSKSLSSSSSSTATQIGLVMMSADNIDARTTTSTSQTSSVTIGVVGCGTIASAIVNGLAKFQQRQQQQESSTCLQIERIVITKRSESKSKQLQSSYPKLVSISETNQQVLDLADIVFITVLPNQTASVLEQLQFTPQRHVLISLVSTCSIDMLCTYSRLPKQHVYKMICLPGVQYNNDGICLLQIPSTTVTATGTTATAAATGTIVVNSKSEMTDPPETTVASSSSSPMTSTVAVSVLMDLLGILGHVVTVTSDEQMSTYMVPTGLMGLFYGILRTNRNWILDPHSTATNEDAQNTVEPGNSKKIATQLILRYYQNMIQDAIRRMDDENENTDVLEALIQEQTRGGLNEQALANGAPILETYRQIQDAMLLRILGQSDGSMIPPPPSTPPPVVDDFAK